MKILVIAPHPDDEVLGCGGTIKKHSNSGDEVYLCVVTKPYTPDWSEEYISQKPKEAKKSSEILGIKEIFFLDQPTVKLDTVGQKKLNDLISEIIRKVEPEVLYIPFFGDINKDHRLVSEACLVAVRPRPSSFIKKVLAYEVRSETDWGRGVFEPFIPNVFVDVSDAIDEKIKAMSCYKTQLKEWPHPRSLEGIKIFSKARGMEAGLEYAEAFMLLRQVKS